MAAEPEKTAVEVIRAVEAGIAELQNVLSELQAGIRLAKEVVIAAQEAEARLKRMFKAIVGMVGLSILVQILCRPRRG